LRAFQMLAKDGIEIAPRLEQVQPRTHIHRLRAPKCFRRGPGRPVREPRLEPPLARRRRSHSPRRRSIDS
jgi:hypothetical protein